MIRFEDSRPEMRMAFRTILRKYAAGVEHHKISMTYRLLVLLRGSFLLRCDGSEEQCQEGDIIFMPPHTDYTTVFGGDSQFLNIFFDFFPRTTVPETMPLGAQYFVMVDYEPICPERFAEKLTFEDVPEFNATFVMRGLPDTLEKCRELYDLYHSDKLCAKLRRNAKLAELLADIADCAGQPHCSSSLATARTIISYINAHYNERLTCRSVAEHFAYHPNYVNRIVRELTGYSLHDTIIRVKIRHADELLLDSDMSITDIAYFLAFHDSSHFSSVYQAHTGMKPSERRRMSAEIRSGL
ncbi:MAG: AraC family transcriptional regulator [Ruminococcaceae bacterium]|nr:AraC family transcriptional regulator [Oscillospiraceae bacterium]